MVIAPASNASLDMEAMVQLPRVLGFRTMRAVSGASSLSSLMTEFRSFVVSVSGAGSAIFVPLDWILAPGLGARLNF